MFEEKQKLYLKERVLVKILQKFDVELDGDFEGYKLVFDNN